jgi:HEAT repeat protein
MVAVAMAEKHWKERWEDDADGEYQQLRALPLDDLRRRLAKGKFGQHHMLWSAIAAKGDLEPVGWELFDFLKSSGDYLQRYHCARALLALLECKDLQPAELAVEHPDPSAKRARVEALLTNALGPRPDPDRQR